MIYCGALDYPGDNEFYVIDHQVFGLPNQSRLYTKDSPASVKPPRVEILQSSCVVGFEAALAPSRAVSTS